MAKTEEPILIAQMDVTGSVEHTGDYYYRTYAPGVSMAREAGTYVINLTNENRLLGKNHRNEASRFFQQAATLEPGSYFPYLYGAFCSDNRAGSLEKALQLNPGSIRAWDLLGNEFLGLGQPQIASTCFECASLVFPAYKPAFRRGILEKDLTGFVQP